MLKQSFQMITGTLKTGGNSVPISNGRLRGDHISFAAGGAQYAGRVNGNTIEGSVTGSSPGSWSAIRGGKPAAGK